ncbi:MAG: NUDIX domain-containing protein [Actinomycetota bacterium]|nr:NUDIX domain-containing protein [Actinomycetota bacterium]
MSETGTDRQRYDAYRQHHAQHGGSEPIPAATVVILRDGDDGIETLMLRKNSKIAFGGMWVFPGGRIDDDDEVLDADGEPDELATAAAAAVREAAEEASVAVDPASLVWFAHWVPPPVMPKRFATFFFAARHDGPASEVSIDNGEITDHEWMHPADAMARRDDGEIELAPPTWMTLHRLSGFTTIADALAELDAEDPPFYETHMARTDAGPVAMWTGDAGYESNDPSIEGPRHRLTLVEDGYVFADTRR